MVNVIARKKGEFGGMIRDAGDIFVVPEEIWNDPKRRPKWCSPAAFGGKGDHDNDGKAGGSKKKPAQAKAQDAEPFGDAPEPQTVAEAQAEIGGVKPDWVAGNDKPVPVKK